MSKAHRLPFSSHFFYPRLPFVLYTPQCCRFNAGCIHWRILISCIIYWWNHQIQLHICNQTQVSSILMSCQVSTQNWSFSWKKIRILKLDQVGEYLSNDFNKYLSEKGIIFERAPPKTFWQNSMPEHLNSSLLEWATSVMIDAGLQKHLWDEIVMSMSLIIKMSPSPKLDMKILYSLYIASLFNSNTWIWSSQEQLH